MAGKQARVVRHAFSRPVLYDSTRVGAGEPDGCALVAIHHGASTPIRTHITTLVIHVETLCTYIPQEVGLLHLEWNK